MVDTASLQRDNMQRFPPHKATTSPALAGGVSICKENTTSEVNRHVIIVSLRILWGRSGFLRFTVALLRTSAGLDAGIILIESAK